MVRSLSRGQFHVTSAWTELASVGEPTGLEPWLGDDETMSVPAPEFEPQEPGLEQLGLPPTSVPVEPELPSPLTVTDVPLAAPEPPAPPTVADLPVAAPESPAPPIAEPRSAVPEPPAAPPSAAQPLPSISPGDPRRTLVSLLARMWLLRTTSATSGAVAIPSAPVPPEAPPAPSLPAAPPSPEETPATVPAPSPPASSAPSPEPSAPASPLVPSHRAYAPAPNLVPDLAPGTAPLPHLGDVEDRRPLSGLASFLAEVATVAEPASPPAPPPVGGVRARYVFRIVHCPHPIPEQPVSRSSCRQHRIAE